MMSGLSEMSLSGDRAVVFQPGSIQLDNGFSFAEEDASQMEDTLKSVLLIPIRIGLTNCTKEGADLNISADEEGVRGLLVQFAVYSHYGDREEKWEELFGDANVPFNYEGFPEGAVTMRVYYHREQTDDRDLLHWCDMLDREDYSVLNAIFDQFLERFRETQMHYVACYTDCLSVERWLKSRGFKKVSGWGMFKYPFWIPSDEVEVEEESVYYLEF